jgi:hypothetical protein
MQTETETEHPKVVFATARLEATLNPDGTVGQITVGLPYDARDINAVTDESLRFEEYPFDGNALSDALDEALRDKTLPVLFERA